jgi:hypothetical protein
MIATDLVTGKTYNFQTYRSTYETPDNPAWIMTCTIPETQKFKLGVVLEVTGAENPGSWKATAHACAMHSKYGLHPDSQPPIAWHSEDPQCTT